MKTQRPYPHVEISKRAAARIQPGHPWVFDNEITNQEGPFEDFYLRRIRYAWEYRKAVLEKGSDSFRLIFGEADHFPGLTVDKFGPVLVTQTLSLGIEKIKPLLFPLLAQVLEEDGLPVAGIYERNDVRVRGLEGLPENTGWYPLPGRAAPTETTTEIEENGIRYLPARKRIVPATALATWSSTRPPTFLTCCPPWPPASTTTLSWTRLPLPSPARP